MYVIIESTSAHKQCMRVVLLHLVYVQKNACIVILSVMAEKVIRRRTIVEKSCYFCFLFTKNYSCSFVKKKKAVEHATCHRTVLPMSLLHFCALTMVVPLLSMEERSTRALAFHQKYLNLCSEDE